MGIVEPKRYTFFLFKVLRGTGQSKPGWGGAFWEVRAAKRASDMAAGGGQDGKVRPIRSGGLPELWHRMRVART